MNGFCIPRSMDHSLEMESSNDDYFLTIILSKLCPVGLKVSPLMVPLYQLFIISRKNNFARDSPHHDLIAIIKQRKRSVE